MEKLFANVLLRWQEENISGISFDGPFPVKSVARNVSVNREFFVVYFAENLYECVYLLKGNEEKKKGKRNHRILFYFNYLVQRVRFVNVRTREVME